MDSGVTSTHPTIEIRGSQHPRPQTKTCTDPNYLMMEHSSKRQQLKVSGKGCSNNTLQKVSRPASFIKIPVNIANKSWKDIRLYVRYLDLKAQSPDLGTFEICYLHRTYQRDIKKIIAKGWGQRVKGKIHLAAYQAVWRLMGIPRVRVRGRLKYRYWKLQRDKLSDIRKEYLKQIENHIREKIARRKQSQMRYALKDKGVDRATFSAKSACLLFGYKSLASGSKLRKTFFDVIPQTPEEAKPFFNRENGRFEERTKSIAL